MERIDDFMLCCRMQSDYDAVVFDLYGTLIDSPYKQELARVEMAAELGVEPSEFQKPWRQFRLQRNAGRLATVEAELGRRWVGWASRRNPI